MGDGGPGGARVPLTYGLAARVPVNLKSTGGMEKQTLDRWALSLSLVLSKRRGICVAVLSQGRPYSVTRKWEQCGNVSFLATTQATSATTAY